MASIVGTSLSSVSIRATPVSAKGSSSYLTNQVLQQIGKKEGVLDTEALKKAGLGPSFASFDVTAITPNELGLVSKNLYALGLIDKTTANLMISAGTNLNSVGNQTVPDGKFNALDYFAARIDNLNKASVGNNQYGFHVVPDYIKTVHALLNLDDFAKNQRSLSRSASSISGQVAAAHQTGGFSIKI
ncbi:hypothetical protein N5D61_06830 [Pseudomonas sp. GD03842]|uniref:hypothetical protein n=1 Tax=Pseudomonas sp. GD03842 TaxID=2975385 RepID=UPI00244B2764|nr:hypothetical protein [Pseudomonas sp. GD03842]MDH0746055.1 hypothetical protein [Pseudomonas sp. GD03842]